MHKTYPSQIDKYKCPETFVPSPERTSKGKITEYSNSHNQTSVPVIQKLYDDEESIPTPKSNKNSKAESKILEENH